MRLVMGLISIERGLREESFKDIDESVIKMF